MKFIFPNNAKNCNKSKTETKSVLHIPSFKTPSNGEGKLVNYLYKYISIT